MDAERNGAETVRGKAAAYRWCHSGPSGAHAWVVPAVLALLPARSGLSILDAGCGNGFLAGRLAALGHRVIGCDASPEGIARARASHPGVRFEVRSVYQAFTDLAPEVDVVVTTEVIEHLYAPRRLVENAFAVLRPGGFLILSTPYHGFLKNLALSLTDRWDTHHAPLSIGGHIKFFSPRTLRALLESCGFEAPLFRNAGRIPWLWKSMVCRARKPSDDAAPRGRP